MATRRSRSFDAQQNCMLKSKYALLLPLSGTRSVRAPQPPYQTHKRIFLRRLPWLLNTFLSPDKIMLEQISLVQYRFNAINTE